MIRLERDPAQRGRSVLAGVGGIVKQGGWLSEQEELRTDDGRMWVADRKGFWMRKVIHDAAGAEVARWHEEGAFARGGTLELAGGGPRARLQPSSRWKERYDLLIDDREVATVALTGSGKVEVDLTEPAADAMLVLAAAWLVKEAGDDAAAASAATAAV